MISLRTGVGDRLYNGRCAIACSTLVPLEHGYQGTMIVHVFEFMNEPHMRVWYVDRDDIIVTIGSIDGAGVSCD